MIQFMCSLSVCHVGSVVPGHEGEGLRIRDAKVFVSSESWRTQG
ncbi:hypothetical protein PPTG_24943 [Phytophthora nicotianae INRA-310]|uniref:Uncharacterized protein n=1 Tax=Phytophthora nicotianae (strain INRA-310) TaxID=761204 RepID=W2PB58_PHYN3|nr:hypothetical protein PPTG_24943 [Phytophthora nicotianae INRA-310]ETM97468.1 hypothetical protein PPTG_24943 [Phytophthora nicotianae INRA-310]